MFSSIRMVLISFIILSSLSGKAQTVTKFNTEMFTRVLDQSNISGKGLFLLTGSGNSMGLQNINLTWIDEAGELRWNKPLLENFKTDFPSRLILVASESSPSVYVVAYKLNGNRPSKFLVFEVDTEGKTISYELSFDLTYSKNILSACASSKGLHLFVRHQIVKGEENNYIRKSGGVFTGQFFIPHQEKTAVFQNMDALFNPATVLSSQQGDILTLYLSDQSSIILYRYDVAKNQIESTSEIQISNEYVLAVKYAREQNGFYHSRDHYYLSSSYSGGKSYSSEFPYGTAHWNLQVNQTNGHTYTFTTICKPKLKVKGRKSRYTYDYMDEVQVYELDTNLNLVDSVRIKFPYSMDKVKGRINLIRPREYGSWSSIHYSVNDEGANLSTLITRSTYNSYGWVIFDLDTGGIILFEGSKRFSKYRNKYRKDSKECFGNSLILDSNNVNLPPEVRGYVIANHLPIYGKSHFVQLVKGDSMGITTLLEHKHGDFFRVIRFGVSEGLVEKEFTIPETKTYLVSGF